MDANILDAIKIHAKVYAPKECCGLIVSKNDKYHEYFPCNNISNMPGEFILDPEDYIKASSTGKIIGVVHSHPNTDEKPSLNDISECNKSKLVWIIYSLQTDRIYTLQPNTSELPLIGRNYVEGSVDCYSLIRDYFYRECSIELPDYFRLANVVGDNFSYHKLYEENGFKKVIDGSIQLHDVFIMRLGTRFPKHAAVYIGNSLVLQQLNDRLSGRYSYDGYWRERTCFIVRHTKYL